MCGIAKYVCHLHHKNSTKTINVLKNFENKFNQVSLCAANDNTNIDRDKAPRKVKKGFEQEATLNKNGLQQLINKYFIINM